MSEKTKKVRGCATCPFISGMIIYCDAPGAGRRSIPGSLDVDRDRPLWCPLPITVIAAERRGSPPPMSANRPITWTPESDRDVWGIDRAGRKYRVWFGATAHDKRPWLVWGPDKQLTGRTGVPRRFASQLSAMEAAHIEAVRIEKEDPR